MPLAGYRTYPRPRTYPLAYFERSTTFLPPRAFFGFFHDPKRESNTLRGETRGASMKKRARVPAIALWRQPPFFLFSFSLSPSPSSSLFSPFFNSPAASGESMTWLEIYEKDRKIIPRSIGDSTWGQSMGSALMFAILMGSGLLGGISRVVNCRVAHRVSSRRTWNTT